MIRLPRGGSSIASKGAEQKPRAQVRQPQAAALHPATASGKSEPPQQATEPQSTSHSARSALLVHRAEPRKRGTPAAAPELLEAARRRWRFLYTASPDARPEEANLAESSLEPSC